MCDDIEDCCASSEIASRHDAAVAAGNPTYNDPKTGYSVFTATALAARKKCCGCGCRHCPFNHAAVPVQRRAAKIQTPALLRGSLVELDADAGIDVLLWSGGKDSLLAARALCREHGNKRRLVLLTTFDAGSRQVAHQEVQIDAICEQAESLDLPLVGCPLVPHIPYGTRLDEALRLVQRSAPAPVARVCTGDLHLEHVAAWREERIGPAVRALGATLHSPLWQAPYESLMRDLEASGTPCRVCAQTGGAVAVGDLFSAQFVSSLPPGVDAFGENGEFHTLAEVWAASRDPLS